MNRQQKNVLALTAALTVSAPVTLLYTDGDGVTSLRYFIPERIERCKNGQVCVRGYDLARCAPRCFRLVRIRDVEQGLRDAVVGIA